jgi:serine/threonine protein phosphatase PrpC
MIHCANIGDSRAVIFSNNDKDEIQAKPISNDHKPELPEEKARIIESGGRVESSYGSRNGPQRVYL